MTLLRRAVAALSLYAGLFACASDDPAAPPPDPPRDVRVRVDGGGTAAALATTPSGLVVATAPPTGLGRSTILRVTEDRRVEQLRETGGVVRALEVDGASGAPVLVWSEEAGGLYRATAPAAEPEVLLPVSTKVLAFARGPGGALTWVTATGLGRTGAAAETPLGPGDRAVATDDSGTYVLTLRPQASATATTRAWEIARVDSGGSATTLASGEGSPGAGSTARALTLDGSSVYAAITGVGVVAVAKSGGAPKVLATRAAAASPIADGAYVYFAPNSLDGVAVARVPVSGGAEEPVARAAGALVRAIAVDGAAVYWAGIDGGVYRATKP